MYRSKPMRRYSPNRERNYEPLMENLSFEQRNNMMGPQRPRQRHFEPKFIRKGPIKHNRPKTLDRPLTPEEGLQLIDLWKKNNFLEFNNWLQLAKAQLMTEFNENSSEGPTKSIKTYTCSMNLVFDFDPNHSMFANGFGKNKKLAKSMATEKLIIDLIQNGRISAGLRENYTQTLKAAEMRELKPSTTSQVKDLLDANLRKKVHSLFKKMQQSLKEDKFAEACERFCKILELKEPEWNEIGHIWSYAIRKKNIGYVKTILDIIANPGFYSSHNNVPQVKESYQEPEENIRNELVKRYGITRAKSENPYERFDVQNFYSDLDDGFTSELSFNLLNKPLGQAQSKELLPRHLQIESLSPFRDYSPKGTPGKGMLGLSKGMNMKGASPGEVNEEFVHERIELRNQLLVNREMKGPSSKLISTALLQEMIDAFLLCGDYNFAINVAELLYSKAKLDDLAFLSTYAANYYSHSLNMLTCELIDCIFSRFDKERYQSELTTTSLSGTITRIGYKYTQEVLIFNSNSEQVAAQKLAKRILADEFVSRDAGAKLSEGEYVLITSLAGSNLINKPANASSTLGEYINSIGNMTFQMNSASNKGLKSFYSTVSDNGSPLEFAMIGYVKEITKELGVKLFVLPTDEESNALAEKTRSWRITRLCNKSYYIRCEEALKTFCSKTCLSSILQQLILAPPTVSKQLMKELGGALVDREIKEHQVNTNLNVFQQKALKVSTSQVLTIIQGPSGSGKTTAAVEITMEWLRQSGGVILACSSNQTTVDNLYQEMLRAGIRAVRAGTGEDEVWDMHYQLKGKLFGNPKNAPEGFRAADVHFMSLRKILWDSSVICTTLAGVTSDFLQNMKFHRVIVDDATVATEVSLLMPLVRNCQQLVLIGDIKQLPPLVRSPLARSKGMAMNLVQTLMKKGVRSFVFPVQYKMHSSLYELPSSLFYNSMIKNGIEDSVLEPITSFPWPNPNICLAILNVEGKEQLVTTSFLNMKEAEVVAEVVTNIIQKSSVDIHQIGIITAYEAQKQRLQMEINFKAKSNPKLFGLDQNAEYILQNNLVCDIELVDESQGMAKDLIILSCVRSNEKGYLGVLKDPRRMNTALTRAKRGLIIIGDVGTLARDGTWNNLVQFAKSHQAILQYE